MIYKRKTEIKETLSFSIHTPNMLKEIAQCSGMSIYRIPIAVLAGYLGRVAARCAVLSDPVLNKLMCDMTLYSAADPESEEHDPVKVEKVLNNYLKYQGRKRDAKNEHK